MSSRESWLNCGIHGGFTEEEACREGDIDCPGGGEGHSRPANNISKGKGTRSAHQEWTKPILSPRGSEYERRLGGKMGRRAAPGQGHVARKAEPGALPEAE